jgi:hypothetical protein
MKIDPHASLLAAQNLRTGDATARGRQASANFFAELKKTGVSAQSRQAQKTDTLAAAKQQPERPSLSSQVHLREAPLRTSKPDQPLAPGSLLNILV